MAALSTTGIGAIALPGNRTLFRVWAPHADELQVVLPGHPDRTLPLQRDERGYHSALHEAVGAGTPYLFRFPDGTLLPDPASRFQPDGVDGPSAIVDTGFDWQDADWKGITLADYIIYELHVGTFTVEGSLDSAIRELPRLRELGITAVELMPIAQFPGTRNWGYDGVFPFAVQNSYGGPLALKRFVDAAHRQGIAVILDVVYNHLGPYGNVLASYGPYFNHRYATPWGDALNFDAAESDEVRAYFIQNALQWLLEFHIDALRLDAIHAIVDTSAYPFLTELADIVREQSQAAGRKLYLIAESDLNDPRLLRPASHSGHGLDGHWLDDFHHAVHTLLTGEQRGYYADFGDIGHLATVLRGNFAYAGDYSAYRKHRHGAPATDLPANRFVVFAQNHDQVGNRMAGDRLSSSVSTAALRLAAAAVLLGPFLPLLWMGEEYGETAPFPFFVDHSDPALITAVREGRKREFADFAWAGEPPDPQAAETFEQAILNPAIARSSPHRELLAYYRRLIALRRELRLGHLGRGETRVWNEEKVIMLTRHAADGGALMLLLCFNDAGTTIAPLAPAGSISVLLDSNDAEWGGCGTSGVRGMSGMGVKPTTSGQTACRLEPWHALLFHTNPTR